MYCIRHCLLPYMLTDTKHSKYSLKLMLIRYCTQCRVPQFTLLSRATTATSNHCPLCPSIPLTTVWQACWGDFPSRISCTMWKLGQNCMIDLLTITWGCMWAWEDGSLQLYPRQTYGKHWWDACVPCFWYCVSKTSVILLATITPAPRLQQLLCFLTAL